MSSSDRTLGPPSRGRQWGGSGPHHLGEQVPVIAVDLGREVVEPQHVVRTVGQDAGAIWGPGGGGR